MLLERSNDQRAEMAHALGSVQDVWPRAMKTMSLAGGLMAFADLDDIRVALGSSIM